MDYLIIHYAGVWFAISSVLSPCSDRSRTIPGDSKEQRIFAMERVREQGGQIIGKKVTFKLGELWILVFLHK